MLRYFFLILSLSTLAFALPSRLTVIQKLFVSTDAINYVDASSINQKKLLSLMGQAKAYKLIFDEEVLREEVLYLRTSFIKEDILSCSLPCQYHDNYTIIPLDANSSKEFVIILKKISHFNLQPFSIFTPFEYDNIMPFEPILYGWSYGMLFFSFINSFIFFLYNRQKSFLYHALLQLSIGFLLVSMSFPKVAFSDINSIFILSCLVNHFSILFCVYLFNTKNTLPKLHKLLIFMLFVNSLLTVLVLFNAEMLMIILIVSTLLYFLYILVGILALRKGNKIAQFYLFAVISLALFSILNIIGIIDLNTIYFTLLIYPLVAIVFSFVLAFQSRQLEKENLQKEHLLTQQSKLASMGEMIANISHQWRQPLTNLSYAFMSINAAFKTKKLDAPFLDKKTIQIEKQLNFMSNTIDDFRNFFVQDKEKKHFDIKQSIEHVVSLLQATLDEHNIKLQVNCEEEVYIRNYENEFAQVLFNLINNAKQALVSKKVENASIYISISADTQDVSIKVKDNAGGIDSSIINKIFEPYFSTKDKGMGIGLYMSKEIVEGHMKGTLEVSNTPDGALFEIRLAI